MPQIPYLTGGESLTAARMNTLTEEASNRTGLALDNHSILFLQNESGIASREDFTSYLGPVFTFGTVRLASYWSRWAYDHSVFTAAAAAAVPYSGALHTAANESRKWQLINPLPSSYFTTIGRIKSTGTVTFDNWQRSGSLFQFSLEAHRRLYTKESGEQELFWLYETYSNSSDTSGQFAFPIRLNRINNLTQAELVFEGVAGGAFDFPYAWNRFQFFRLHKMDAGALTVRFCAADGSIAHSVTVDGYSSQCVRRDAVSGFPEPTWIYTTGYRYFQKFLPGDPRFYQHRAGSSEGVNNVFNPSIYIPFVNRLLAGYTANRNSGQASQICRPTAFLDNTERAPLPTGDSENTQLRSYGDLYGATDGATKLGDALHCRGEFWEVKSKAGEENEITRHEFTSYANIGDSLSVQSVGGEIQIKTKDTDATFKHDLLAISTNFFCGYGNLSPSEMRPVVNVDDWFSLPRSVPLVRNLKIDQTTTSSVVSYNSVTAGGGLGAVNNRTITRNTLSFVRADSSATPGLANTIEDAKANYFGQQTTPYGAFLSIGVKNSSSGLVIYGEQTIPLVAPFSQGVGNLPNLDLSYYLGVMCSGNIITPTVTDYLTHELASWRVTTQTEKGLQFSLVVTWTAPFTGNGWPDVDGLASLPYCYSGFLTARQTRTYGTSPVAGGVLTPVAGAHPDFIYEELADGRDSVYIGTGFYPVSVQVPTPLSGNDYQYAGVAGRLNNPDVLHGALRGINQEDYWTENRERLLLNQVYYNSQNDGSDFRRFIGNPIAQGYYVFSRMEMAAEHYNNLAAKINSIARVKPLNWEDHGVVPHQTDPEQRLRIRPNSRSILDAVRSGSWYSGLTVQQRADYDKRLAQWVGLRPATQYAAFMNGDLIASAIAAAGITAQNVSDLPNDFGTLRTNPARTTRLKLVGNVTFSDSISANPDFYDFFQRIHITHTITNPAFNLSEAQESYSESGFCRPDLASVTQYAWISNAQIRAYAESQGYKCAFPKFGVGYDLTLFDISAPSISSSAVSVSVLASIGHAGIFFQDEYVYANYAENFSIGGHPPLSALIPEFVIDQPVQVELESTNPFISRALEFVPGTSWIADGRNIQKQPMDWADILPAFTSGTFSDNVPRRTCELIETPTVTPQSPGTPGLGCDGQLHTVPWIQKNKSNLFVSMAAQNILLNVPELFRRVNYSNQFGLAATARNPVEYTTDLICREPLSVIDVSDDMPDETQVIESPIPWLNFTPNFSATSADAAKARASFGTVVLPFTVQPTGAQRVQLWADFTEAVP